jgi:hypothetical protein
MAKLCARILNAYQITVYLKAILLKQNSIIDTELQESENNISISPNEINNQDYSKDMHRHTFQTPTENMKYLQGRKYLIESMQQRECSQADGRSTC